MILTSIQLLAYTILMAWIITSITIEFSKFKKLEIHKSIKFVWYEAKPLYLPAAVVHITCLGVKGEMLNPMNIFGSFCILTAYFSWRNLMDDDDRWKKRKKKVLDKVKRLGSKLVVVPNN